MSAFDLLWVSWVYVQVMLYGDVVRSPSLSLYCFLFRPIQSVLSMVAETRVRHFDCVRLALLFQLRYGKQSSELQEIRKALSGGARNLGDKGKQVRMGRGGGREWKE